MNCPPSRASDYVETAGTLSSIRREACVPERNVSRISMGGTPRLDDLTPVIFVTTGGVQVSYSAGNTASTPFFFNKTTMNFAGFVVLTLRPTVCTSPGPS
jgi:hypothetical protein